MARNIISAMGFALNTAADQAPDWVQLTPAGERLAGRDGRSWRMSNPEAVIAAFHADPKRPQIDVEHSSQLRAPKGDPAPAVGWIEDIEMRDGALWGRVEWTDEGRNAVSSRAYRYLSPAFRFDRATTEVRAIVSAGLTNNPNLELAALNASHNQEDPDMEPILQALGLNQSATTADAVVAITKLREARDTALNAAQTPDPDKFVPAADHQLALNRIAAFEADQKQREELAINSAVDQAITEGKIAPASRDYHIAACRAEGGLERFKTAMQVTPVIGLNSALDKSPDGAPILDPDALAMCRQMGLDPKEFAAAQKEYAQ